MNKTILITFLITLFSIFILYPLILVLENKFISSWIEKDSRVVDIKIFTKSDCDECIKLDKYLEVYKKAWVKFWNISVKEYGGWEYKAHFNEYNITKLPFIVFSKEMANYDTIANSWNDTFGYKNDNLEFIPTDIIPPYFNINTKKIEWLIDITYIWNNVCKNCYTLENAMVILSNFGLKFKNIKKIDWKSKEAMDYINKYNITTLPVVLLSDNTSLYTNFSYFWQTIWSIEKDGEYILRKPWKLGLDIDN